jgi:hypothetical protein
MKRVKHNDLDWLIPGEQTISGPLFDAPAPGPFDQSQATPTDEEQRIAEIIFARSGWQNAMPIAEIVKATGIDERGVRRVKEALVRTHHCLIGGVASNGGNGYFWITNSEDQRTAAQAYRKQIIAMAASLRIIDSADSNSRFFGQLKLGREVE